MKKQPYLLLFLLLLCGCTPKVYLTQGMRNNLSNKSIDLTVIQYYNDVPIVMKRQLSTGETKTSKGTIKFEGDKQIEYVTIPAHTPGICIDRSTPDKLYIKFDADNTSALWFANSNGTYEVAADKWYDNNKVAKVTYNGKQYFISHPDTWARLMVKKDSHVKVEETNKVAKGAKIK